MKGSIWKSQLVKIRILECTDNVILFLTKVSKYLPINKQTKKHANNKLNPNIKDWDDSFVFMGMIHRFCEMKKQINDKLRAVQTAVREKGGIIITAR